MSKPLIIETREVKRCGLTCFQVRINGTLLCECMSKEFADAKKKKFIHAWNVERIGELKKAS